MFTRLFSTILVGAITVPALVGSTVQSTCAQRIAWAGSESSAQFNQATLFRVPISIPMTITRVTVSNAYAQRNGAPGFAQELMLVGISTGPTQHDENMLPALPGSGDFAPNIVGTTGGSPHNENAQMSNAVIGSAIVKSYVGAGSSLTDVPIERVVNPGDEVWVYYGSMSGMVLDPEVQVTITYIPALCG